MAAGPAANFLAALLVFSGLAYFVGKTIVPPRVGGVAAGSAAEAAGLRPGDLIKSLDGRPVAAFGDVVNFVSLRPGQAIAIKDRARRARHDVNATPADRLLAATQGASPLMNA